MPEEHLPGNAATGFRLFSADGTEKINISTSPGAAVQFAEFVVDEELEQLRDEFRVWLDGLSRLAGTLVNEARSPQRAHTVIALRKNIELVNDSLQKLTAAVDERTIE